jgi:Domain of unknown function (DUF4383)
MSTLQASSATHVPLIRRAVLAISLALLAWSLAGLIANPDFATGAQATAEQVLFVDFNGWHALSGIALAAPGLLAWRRASWSLWFAVAAAAALAATGVWALLDTSPAGVVAFPNNEADALLHFAFAALYGGAAALHLRARNGQA